MSELPTSETWNDCFEIASKTDIGLRRSNNQDSLTVSLARDWEDWKEVGHLLVVADGMGAHAAGELASKLAVDHISHLYKKHLDAGPPHALVEAISGANAEIHQKGQVNLSFYNMGTTCSTLLLLPQGAMVGHVGDSRVYRFRANKLEQLTFDHSLVWEMGHREGESTE
ncbi:MAG: protein phosphatase 2C domain-containing protein, partial [Planctomycetota bacterium]